MGNESVDANNIFAIKAHKISQLVGHGMEVILDRCTELLARRLESVDCFTVEEVENFLQDGRVHL